MIQYRESEHVDGDIVWTPWLNLGRWYERRKFALMEAHRVSSKTCEMRVLRTTDQLRKKHDT